MKSKFLLAFLVAIGLCITASTANAVDVNIDITAEFDDASGAGVDTWPGIVGEGWATAWGTKRSGGVLSKSLMEFGDTGYLAFDGDDDNYLSLTVTNPSDQSGGKGSIFRDYTGNNLSFSQDYNISFKVRTEDISTMTDTKDEYTIFGDSLSAPLYNVSTGSSFCIRAKGYDADPGESMEWYFFNGDNNGSVLSGDHSGIYVQESHLYDFDVTMHPSTKTWDVTLTDLTAGTPSYTATGLGWRGDTDGGVVVFSGRENDSAGAQTMSIDDIHVTQSYSYDPISEVVANFDGGNSTAVVDGFAGKGGDGWASEWRVNIHAPDTGTVVSTTSVITSVDAGYQELHAGDGNYLKVEVNNPSDTARLSVSRSYRAQPSIDFTEEHTIEFTIRIDELDMGGEWTNMDEYNDRYWVTSSNLDRSVSSSSDTFFIIANGAPGDWGDQIVEKWAFANGDKAGGITEMIGSGISLATDGVYDFTITMNTDDQTYDVVLTDGTSTFTADGLGWRTDSEFVGGFLNFGAICDSWIDTRSMSLDNIRVSQELDDKIPGDANHDGKVDGSDVTILADNWQAGVPSGNSGVTWEMGDFNGDHMVDGSDVTILADNWQFGVTTAAAAVPEPSTLIGLLTLLLAGYALVRRR